MDKFMDYLKKRHFPVSRDVSDEEISAIKNRISDEEFNQRFFQYKNGKGYYEKLCEAPEDNELIYFLIDKLIKEQTEARKKISVIEFVIVAYFICSILAALLIFL